MIDRELYLPKSCVQIVKSQGYRRQQAQFA